MKNRYFLFLLLISLVLNFKHSFAQSSLPEITVNGFGNKVIISWLNDYEKPVTNIFIQRSFDSLKNFTTIGSVLIPQNKENGYPDNNPPYNKMYYRVSVTFEGGTYEIGPSFKVSSPVKELAAIDITDTTRLIKFYGYDSKHSKDLIIVNPQWEKPIIPNNSTSTTENTTSKSIFINKQNSLTLHLPQANLKKYVVKFYDEKEKMIFELNKLTEEYLIVEKSNFLHAGWFSFELFEENKLLEKNRFLIMKDYKLNGK
jgi:hypothetical protein